MKKLFLSVIAAGMLLSACNQTPKNGTAETDSLAKAPITAESGTIAANLSAASAPVMKFEKESFDFGKIKEGDKVSYSFKFTNTGKSPLIITNAVASCGCTTPEWPKAPIRPGEGGQIKVVFNSAGKGGLQDKQITVTANTAPAENMVHLVGEVLKK